MISPEFIEEIMSCRASFTEGTRYEDGAEYEHGFIEGSLPCSCGHHRHFQTNGGKIYPSVYDVEDK